MIRLLVLLVVLVAPIPQPTVPVPVSGSNLPAPRFARLSSFAANTDVPVDASVTNAEGAIGLRATLTGPYTYAGGAIFTAAGNWFVYTGGSAAFLKVDNGTETNVLTGIDLTKEVAIVISWNAAAGSMTFATFDGTVTTTRAYNGTLAASLTTWTVGGRGGGYIEAGTYTTFCQSKTAAGVRFCLR